MTAIRFPLERQDQLELLDLGYGADRDVGQNLKEMDRINRWFGGDAALLRHLLPRIRQLAAEIAGPIWIADLGTGMAGMLQRLAKWSAKNGYPLKLLGLDWSARNLRHAPPAPLQRVCADALHPPFAQAHFIISSLFLHHLKPEELTLLLETAAQRAKAGVIMSDLVRGRLPLAAFHSLSPILARNYLTRNDGALSIRRAYTPHELLDMAARAGLTNAAVYTHFPWRMTLVVDR